MERHLFFFKQTIYRNTRSDARERPHVQLVGAVARLVHAMALLQQLEQLLHGDARVRGAPQGEDLPHQHPERPAAETETHRGGVRVTVPEQRFKDVQ